MESLSSFVFPKDRALWPCRQDPAPGHHLPLSLIPAAWGALHSHDTPLHLDVQGDNLYAGVLPEQWDQGGFLCSLLTLPFSSVFSLGPVLLVQVGNISFSEVEERMGAEHQGSLLLRLPQHDIPPSSVPLERWSRVLGILLGLRCTNWSLKGPRSFLYGAKGHPGMPGHVISATEGGVFWAGSQGDPHPLLPLPSLPLCHG